MGIVIVLVVFASIFCRLSVAAGGEPVVYFPPFELRTVAGDGSPFLVPVGNGIQRNFQDGREQRTLLHTTAPQFDQHQHHITPPEPEMKELPPPPQHNQLDDNSTVNVHQLLHALGIEEEHEHEEKEHSRAAGRDYEYPPGPQYSYPAPSYPSYSPYQHPPSYGYPSKYPSSYQSSYPSSYSSSYPSSYPSSPPSYGGPPAPYQPPAAYVPPTAAHQSLKPLINKLDLAKPLATKVAGKVSGFLGLILSLFTGSSPDKLALGGLKDVVINGIVKPLLAAKGGLKSLISKLTIPVISLLLINLEVLITVWWLWEDCPQNKPYEYSKPTYSSSYNPYR